MACSISNRLFLFIARSAVAAIQRMHSRQAFMHRSACGSSPVPHDAATCTAWRAGHQAIAVVKNCDAKPWRITMGSSWRLIASAPHAALCNPWEAVGWHGAAILDGEFWAQEPYDVAALQRPFVSTAFSLYVDGRSRQRSRVVARCFRSRAYGTRPAGVASSPAARIRMQEPAFTLLLFAKRLGRRPVSLSAHYSLRTERNRQ
jgi:hypothetical protein